MVEPGRYICILKFIYDIIKHIYFCLGVNLPLIDVCSFKVVEPLCEL